IGLKKQKSNIIINALSVSDNTDSCIIYGEKNHLIATIGVSGLIIIQTPDATLIAKKEEAQKIKKIVDKLTGSKQLTKYA
ncbi:MAG: mannose-1-phosphate guanylyltransferase, partial [Candidatus Omnitrophica bacterium]|nr:mannose-1-phosphate guanylyltransferase [Candidatus Omnitrophota bacterium]